MPIKSIKEADGEIGIVFNEFGSPGGALSRSSSTTAVSVVSKLPTSIDSAMPSVGIPNSTIEPPKMMRLTLGKPQGST